MSKVILTNEDELRAIMEEVLASQNTVVQESSIAKNQDQDILLTRYELRDMLKISLPTLWKWTTSGRIPFKKMGRRMYFSKNEVLKRMEEEAHATI